MLLPLTAEAPSEPLKEMSVPAVPVLVPSDWAGSRRESSRFFLFAGRGSLLLNEVPFLLEYLGDPLLADEMACSNNDEAGISGLQEIFDFGSHPPVSSVDQFFIDGRQPLIFVHAFHHDRFHCSCVP